VRRDGCARTAHSVEREVLRSSRLHSDPLLASAPPISPRRIQVSVAEQDAPGQRGHVAALGPASIGWLGLAIALVASSFVLPWRLEPASPVAVCLVLATFVVAEFYNLHIEFRRQTMSVSASELAFVVALIEIGPVWTALTRALAIAGFCIVQRLSLPKVVTNTAIAVVEVCVAVAVLRVLPVGVLSDPLTWVSYLVAIVLPRSWEARSSAWPSSPPRVTPAGRSGRACCLPPSRSPPWRSSSDCPRSSWSR
jgi:hypothetical protein